MFSQALLYALWKGEAHLRHSLSLRDVRDLATDFLSNLQIRNVPRPVIHSPDQSEGDVADVPFFPNPAFRSSSPGQATNEQEGEIVGKLLVWFIMSGESTADAGLPISCQEGAELTARGHEQAQEIAVSFNKPPSLIITSPYLEARQTAVQTQMCFPEVPVEEWPVHEITYLSLSHSEKTTLQEKRPMVEAFWEAHDPFYTDGEGAESFADFISRVQGVLRRLRNLDENFVVVFSHEQFLRAVHWLLVYKPNASSLSQIAMWEFAHLFKIFSIPNGAIMKTQFLGEQTVFEGITAFHQEEEVLEETGGIKVRLSGPRRAI